MFSFKRSCCCDKENNCQDLDQQATSGVLSWRTGINCQKVEHYVVIKILVTVLLTTLQDFIKLISHTAERFPESNQNHQGYRK